LFGYKAHIYRISPNGDSAAFELTSHDSNDMIF